MLFADLWSWLPDNLLERGDRMSMAASLELRPPLLDHRLVELAFRSALQRQGARRAHQMGAEGGRPAIPAGLDGRPAQGRLPGSAGRLVPLTSCATACGTGLPAPNRSSARPSTATQVRKLLQRHESGTFNEESRIWTLMSLEVWHETFFRAGAAVGHG